MNNIFTDEMLSDVANRILNYTTYQREELKDFVGDALLWVCLQENQKKLSDMGVTDVKSICKVLHNVITWNYIRHFNKHERNKVIFSDIDGDDGFILENYSCTNETELLKNNFKDELIYVIDNLSSNEISLLVDLCVNTEYDIIALTYGWSYQNTKQRVCRLRKKCKKLFEEAITKLY